MKIRIRKRRDNPLVRRWFALLHGYSNIDRHGRWTVTRIFFPWFYVDFVRVDKEDW